MASYADLELSINKQSELVYSVELRFSRSDSDADNRLGSGQVINVTFDFDALKELAHLPEEYGQALSSALFTDPDLRAAFSLALASAMQDGVPLRLRILIGPSAPELHSLHWETLRNPNDNSPLLTNENLLFSRYLASTDWRSVRLLPKGDLKALAVVANPQGLENLKLAALDVSAETERAKSGLVGIRLALLPEGGKHASLSRLTDYLRTYTPDVLYVVAHGYLANGQPYLCLENDQGGLERVSAIELITRIKELQNQPRLVILVSCQSAGKDEGEALSALGPRLAEAGVPAVVAMQGNVSIETADQFISTFFSQLQRDGQIDRAMVVARGAVRQRPDYWSPALFMRLKSGRLWYTPGVSVDGKEFGKFPAVIRNIRRVRSTPILGPGLTDTVFGSTRSLARRWAEKFRYPMAPHERESLPQVAQYLSISQDPLFPIDEFEEYLREHILSEHKDDLPPELLSGAPTLDTLIDAMGAHHRQQDEFEPHRVLAGLDLPIYITANPDSQLEAALFEAGKAPQSVLCPWNDEIDPPEIQTPDPAHPLVYHIFGRWNRPESLVLTEDQYFAFLIGATRNTDIIPERVREALTNAGLLFLGFQTDEWPFRVLFQTILSQSGSSLRSNYAQVAAQMEPDDERLLEPQRARKYLEKYLAKDADIEIYWGSPQEFLGELARQIKNR